jgi:hypothetical protein
VRAQTGGSASGLVTLLVTLLGEIDRIDGGYYRPDSLDLNPACEASMPPDATVSLWFNVV